MGRFAIEKIKVADLYEDMLKYGLDIEKGSQGLKRSTTFKKNERSLIVPAKRMSRPSVKIESTQERPQVKESESTSARKISGVSGVSGESKEFMPFEKVGSEIFDSVDD